MLPRKKDTAYTFKGINKEQIEFIKEAMPIVQDSYFTSQLLVAAKEELATAATKTDNSSQKNINSIGGFMEQSLAELQLVNAEVEKSKQILSDLFEEIKTVRLETSQQLSVYIREVRDNRMAVERETKIILTTLRDVRKFFLEHEYKDEVARLNEFMELCKKLKAVADDGTLDSVADTIIRLQLGSKG